MKTYRQELQKWLETKKETLNDSSQVSLISEIQDKVKELESLERHMVNGAYDRGYNDKSLNKGNAGNYYNNTYKLHELLMSFKNNYDGNNSESVTGKIK